MAATPRSSIDERSTNGRGCRRTVIRQRLRVGIRRLSSRCSRNIADVAPDGGFAAQRHHHHGGERQRHRPQRGLGRAGAAGTPGSRPATRPAAITPAELTSPTSIPTCAPRAVSRRHQMPEHEQRAERGRGDRERRGDERSDVDLCRGQREQHHDRGGSERGQPQPAQRRRDQVVRDRAGDREQQPQRRREERGEGAGGEQRGEQVALPSRVDPRGKRDDDGVGARRRGTAPAAAPRPAARTRRETGRTRRAGPR